MKKYVYEVLYKEEDFMIDPLIEDDLNEDEIKELKIVKTFATGEGLTESAAWARFEKHVEYVCHFTFSYKINKEKMELFIEDCDIQLTMNIIFREEVIDDPE